LICRILTHPARLCYQRNNLRASWPILVDTELQVRFNPFLSI
jgi:hypothetical protein